jgi:hypothetical protein
LQSRATQIQRRIATRIADLVIARSDPRNQ